MPVCVGKGGYVCVYERAQRCVLCACALEARGSTYSKGLLCVRSLMLTLPHVHLAPFTPTGTRALRSSVIGLATGFGIGRSMNQCEHEFDRLRVANLPATTAAASAAASAAPAAGKE